MLALFFLASNSSVFAFSFGNGPPNKLTGAPGEGNCTQCHVGNTLNASGGSLMLTVPENYLPGEVYDIVVELSRAGQSKWGFEMTALNSNGASAGTFATADGNTQLSEENSKQYIKHTSAGSAQGTRDKNQWTVKWTAPATDIGPITFYAAGNAANSDFGTSGDYIYTQKATSDVPPVYGVTLAGVGALTKRTADASSGVTYTIKVTNTGNTDDVISLSSSGSVSASLSRTSVSLAAGASANVTLTVPGTALAKAGDYTVKVKATSRGDSTKTAEVTTTTTILSVYGVTLGIDALTKKTEDASEGVTYTLKVTNTGNTTDTIRLATSGDATATLSRTSISLAAGVSAEVTLTVSGSALAKAGNYKVKVTATSQGNTMKTADVLTTTTILSVYGVTLVGVGDLTTETADASEDVAYTLKVTNTGNTDDMIDLATSGDVAASLNETSVSLAAGASAEVTLTVSGDVLAKAGDYEVKVTATSQGDDTKIVEVSTKTTILPVYGVTLVGVGDLTTETADASEGVTYTLKVTNTGNTDDMIDLATSGDVAATLSETSVSLAPNTSAEVTLTVSGDALAIAGDYEVKVMATSQGDDTKIVEVSTKTTILPVYGVTLAGVGDLITETADASEGVTYTLKITNTGNTDDMIDLSTSGDVAATLSETSVSLAPNASAEVTLTVSGDALAIAGDYEVKVTATSQGDDTKMAEVSTTTTILPFYGVTLAGVGDLTTETVDAGKGVGYTLKITNISNTDDVIDLTTSGDIAATLSQTIVSLAAGASAEITLTISGDALAIAGDYEVKVTATSQGDDTKMAEVSTKTTILPVYGITLAGVGDLATETSDAGEGVSYMLTFTNIGNTDDMIDLSTSGDVAATLSETSVSLAPNASAEVTLTVSGDALAIAGGYEVKVTAISQGDDTKMAEVSTTTTILPFYGVTLAGVGDLTIETSDAGEGVSYMLTVTNTGNTDDMIDLATSGDVAASLNETSVSLAAGASAEVTLTVSGDVLAKAGDYEVKVTATSQGDDTKIVEVSTKTTILPVYGVTLAGVGDLITETADASEGVTYTLKVTNTGNTDDMIDLSTSGDVAASLNETSVSLAPNASAEVTLTVSGDVLAKAGDYEVKVTATSQGDDTKMAEVSTTTTILPFYGVTLVGVGDLTTETVDAGEGVSYMLTVTNIGNTDDMIDLATSGDVAATLSETSVSLAPNASAEVTLTVSGDALAIAGTYEVKVTATSQGDNTKTAEITTTTTILPVYGVTLSGVDELTTKTADASEGVSYMLTVTNIGNTDDMIDLAASGDVAATLSQTSVSLAPNASAEVTLTVSGDALAIAGAYEVKVTATSQGDTEETAEVSTKTTILPVYGVTLAGVGDLATETSDAGEGVSYMLKITNTGNTDDMIDLATSGDVAATLSETSVSLAPNASAEVMLAISGDALATAGDYEVKVTATSQGDTEKTAEVSTKTTILPVFGVTLAGVDRLTKETIDASAGVSYTLRVTNTGNTNDTISLSASGDASATLSETSVSLGAGASAEIILTVSDDVLATAGAYEVKVTATSQGDATKTAEISTTTTISILPVYGVALAGVGDLTTETSDVGEDASYTIAVSNIGNTDDVIDLVASGDVTATLSQTAVSLGANASAEVTLTISGSALTIFGDYEVKVTATSQGDTTETAEITMTTTLIPVYGITLAGVGDLTTETADAGEGVSYMLKITNTGNTDDVLDLATSGDASATLSETSVSLAAGTSAEIILTVSDDVLATAGAYEVKVTATSQGDGTKTADISTTTTILPVYDVTLVGVGDLTTETADAGEGVSYTIAVTNTGNTDDVIDLVASGDVTATLSQTAASLGANTSAEVTLTVSGSALAKAGDYKVKVTATSQGDGTKTADISTTTTILPVYDVTLVGVGDLTTETADVGEGVSYTIAVTNTGNTDDVLDLATSGDASATLSETSVSLAAGTSAEIILTVSDDVLATAGAYEVKVTATSQGDGTKTADISTTTTILPVYGVALAGVGDLTTETADAGEGVSYTLRVMNTGNTDDVVDLATSGDVSAALSETSVSLAAGASVEVILAVDGTALVTAGDYVVKVTATSQGDNTKTAEITTTTTIPPVYGVMLQGEGELKGATMDMFAGVSYTITVTNTGNIDDTVVLGSSAEIGIEGSVLGSFSESDDQEIPTSQLKIELAPGASAEVTFIAAGDFFTKLGEYEIKVIATSKGDSTKTAEITTATTIEPVPWDLNADGKVNIQDLVLVANQFGESDEELSGDVNMDGKVDIRDLVQVASYFGKTQAEIVQANQ